jgi:ribonuclease Z
MLFEDEKVEVHSFPLQHRIHCNGFLFREKKQPRKIDKYKLEKNKVSTADIQLLRKGLDVVNADGDLVKNTEVTIDPLPPRSFAYCSDTRYNEEVCSYIQGVDLLYHESTFLEDQAPRAAKTFHSTAKQAAEIAHKAGVKQLLLGHFSARYRVLDDFIKEATQIYPNCVLASDGKLFKI